jgi:transposase
MACRKSFFFFALLGRSCVVECSMSTTASTPETLAILTTALSLEDLPNDVAALKEMILELVMSLRRERGDNESLRYRLDGLLRRLYGRRNERYDPKQPWLFDDMAAAAGQGQDPAAAATKTEPAAEAAPATQATQTKPKRKCKPHGRRQLPANLPREPKHHELPQAERVCVCGQLRIDIGTDVSQQLEYRPASVVVIDHFTHKYLCPCCSKPAREQEQPGQQSTPTTAVIVVQAEEPMEPSQDPASGDQPATQPSQQACSAAAVPAVPPTEALRQPEPRAGVVIAAAKPAMPIPKGLPGPGLLAHLIVSKYVDHLPLYRLERVYERQGIFLPRSTLCDWLAASAHLLQPLYDLMVRVVLQSLVIHTDDTPVNMQDRATRNLIKARFWTYLGDRSHSYNVFDFTTSRKRDGPQNFLANFEGYLQADAFSGYDCLYLPHPSDGVARIHEVACNAHARRKFYDARASDDVRAHVALGYYGQLYTLERHAKGLEFDEDQRQQMRQDLSVVILNKFHAWLDKARTEILPKSPIGEAIAYALNNWPALKRYTEKGFLDIDNNIAEREMKRIAIGRKNWLFVGSEKGGRTAAVLISFTSTCARLGIEPWAYLQDVLSRLPTIAPGQLTDLLPDRWQAAHSAATAAATPPPPSDPVG